MKKKRLYDELYKQYYLIIWDLEDGEEDAAKLLISNFLRTGDADEFTINDYMAAAYYYRTPFNGRHVLLFRQDDDLIEYLGSIAHECLHAAQSVFHFTGVDWAINPDTGQEAGCYYTEYLIRQVYKIIGMGKWQLQEGPIKGKVES
jgi:hypothetical protein